MSWLGSAFSKAASSAVAAASSAAADVSAPAREFLLREATIVQNRVIGTAKMWTGAEPPSAALLELLQTDGFATTSSLPGKWVNPERGDAVRVPWRLVPDVEGTLTLSLSKDAFGAVRIRAELDSLAFPTMLRPFAHEATGNFSVPIPTMGLKYGSMLAVGFFAYFDIAEEPPASRTYVVRMGGKFELVLGVSLLPSSLTKPFPQPLPVVFSHNFAASAAAAERVVERGVMAIANSQAHAGGAGPAHQNLAVDLAAEASGAAAISVAGSGV